MERLAYFLKYSFPQLFRVVAACAERVTAVLYGRRVTRALQHARIEGDVRGKSALIRPLVGADVDSLGSFLRSLEADYVRFFRPHEFDRSALATVVASKAYLTYGVFVEEEIVGYALLKISPTGSAFIGLLVRPEFGGVGLGRFIVDYLYWQASLSGLRTRSTISRENPASLRSHQAVAEFEVVAHLPNDYIMIEFPKVSRQQPELHLV